MESSRTAAKAVPAPCFVPQPWNHLSAAAPRSLSTSPVNANCWITCCGEILRAMSFRAAFSYGLGNFETLPVQWYPV